MSWKSVINLCLNIVREYHSNQTEEIKLNVTRTAGYVLCPLVVINHQHGSS